MTHSLSLCIHISSQALEAHWIKKCDGYDNYVKAPIFQIKEQSITRARKMQNAKRKADFAASQTEEKKICKKKKAPMTAVVRVIVCECVV